MRAALAFSDVLDAKLQALVSDRPAAPTPAAGSFHFISASPDVAATRPLAPPAFEAESIARTAYRFRGSAFHLDGSVPTLPAPNPAQEAPRRLSIETPGQHAALAILQALGAGGLRADSTDQDLKRAFRQIARRLHPDSQGHLSEDERRESAARFAEAAAAYHLLLNDCLQRS